MSEQLIAALVPAGPIGEIRVETYGWRSASPGWTVVGAAADQVDVVGLVVAFRSSGDQILQIHRADTGSLNNVGQTAEEFVLGERIVAFRTPECDVPLDEGVCPGTGKDLNRDGDLDDDVLQVFDLVSRLFNTEQAVTPCPLEACDPRFPYRVEGDTVTFITSEAEQGGQDLNGDGDATDLVKQVFNAREAALLAHCLTPISPPAS